MIDAVAYIEDAGDAEFDEATHVWTIRGRRARVVIATDGTLPAAFAGGPSPYLGVAVHGVPNYFLVTGPDVAAQKGYIAKCLDHLDRTDSTRIEVRPSTQRVYNDRSHAATHRSGRFWRKVGRRIPSAFEVSSLVPEDGPDDTVYAGEATIVVGDRIHEAHVRLTGQLDPNDGQYHWQGTIFDIGLSAKLPQEVTVTIGDRTARGRLTERTPWSTFSVVGLGAPPFALDAVEVVVPLL